jgi:phenylalanyl-tRNA synthetase beta chain
MATITIKRKTFEKEIGKLTEEMCQKIAGFGTTIEKQDKESLELDITPNRPDLLSYQGFKRSFLLFLEKRKELPEYKINKPEKEYKVIIDKSVNSIRPYTACAIIKKLKFDEEKIKEIIDIQEKLHNTLGRKRKKLAIGIYPLEKIKLPITFKALEPDKIKFIPLESPGQREMSGLQILQRHPTGRDYASLLAGKEKFPIFIDANGEILSMPPIINSEKTGRITEKTKEVFIEVSGFNFENLKQCLNIIVSTLAEMGGEIYQMELIGAPEKISPNLTKQKTNLELSSVEKTLGIKLTEKEIKNLLRKMGHEYKGRKIVESPPWRTDILAEIDLVEEIAIAYGYDKFIPEIPDISTIGKENPEEALKKRIAEILSGLGFLEVSNYHLTTKKDSFEKMGIPKKEQNNFLEVENSKTEYSIFRSDLSSYLLKNLSENIDSEYPQKIFETGIIAEKKASLIKERKKLAIAITPGNYTELKQTVEYLFRMLGKEIQIKDTREIPPFLIDGRTAELFIKETSIGKMGEVHPKILKNWKIKMPVSILEIDLKEIFN